MNKREISIWVICVVIATIVTLSGLFVYRANLGIHLEAVVPGERIVGKPLKLSVNILSGSPESIEWSVDGKYVGQGEVITYLPVREITNFEVEAKSGGKVLGSHTFTLHSAPSKFSSMRIKMDATHTTVPATIKLSIVDAFGKKLSGVAKKHLEVPGSWEAVGGDKWRVSKPGNHRITAEVIHEHFNRTIETSVLMKDLERLSVLVKPSLISEVNREPASYKFSAEPVGTHPEENIKSIVWTLGGKRYRTEEVAINLPSGVSELEVSIETDFGRTATVRERIKVAENQLPVCVLSRSFRGSVSTFYADCTDSDGKIIDYRWYLNGKLTDFRTKELSVARNRRNKYDEVKVAVTDDSHQSATYFY